MTKSSAIERSPMVEKLLNRTPKYEPEVEDAMEAFSEARAKGRETVMLAVRLVSGEIESFSYAYLTRVSFKPDDTMTLRFGSDVVQIKGRNLRRLCDSITEHRVRFIQEGSEAEDDLKSDGKAHVDEITISEMEGL
jgi:serine phosphatase RsbU (regulator of sigma subunit)